METKSGCLRLGRVGGGGVWMKVRVCMGLFL